MTRKLVSMFAAVALVAVACGAPEEEGVLEAEMSKEEVRSQGKADWGFDVCWWFGWYGDGVCDTFCPLPDPDCHGRSPGGSCEGACGGRSPSGTCWCDDACVDWGDCCHDKQDVCDAPPPPPAGDCFRTGCSSQVCADDDVFTTCEWRPEYACYQEATCERQADGECGFTMDAALTECLAGAGQ
jgi:hypothetical protein